MKVSRRSTVLALASLALFAVAGAAQAQIMVTYAVGGWADQFPSEIPVPPNAPWGQDGYPGDTVELIAHSGQFALTSGASYLLKLNTLHWSIDYTYGGVPEPWPDLLFDFDPVRNLTLNGATSGPVSQTGHLLVNYYNDYLSFTQGPTSDFVVDGFIVHVTPLALAQVGGTNFDGGNPWLQPEYDIMGRFDIEDVPEPSTLAMGVLLLALAGGGALRSTRRRPAR